MALSSTPSIKCAQQRINSAKQQQPRTPFYVVSCLYCCCFRTVFVLVHKFMFCHETKTSSSSIKCTQNEMRSPCENHRCRCRCRCRTSCLVIICFRTIFMCWMEKVYNRMGKDGNECSHRCHCHFMNCVHKHHFSTSIPETNLHLQNNFTKT